MRWKLMGLAFAVALTGFAVSPEHLFGQAFGVPISDRVLEGELQLVGQSKPFQFSLREGSLLTLEDSERGLKQGFVVHFQGDEPSFLLVEIGSGGAVNQLGDSEVSILLDSRVSVQEGLPYSIHPVRIVSQSFATPGIVNPRGVDPDKLYSLYGENGGGVCCVTCGAITLCSTSVNLSCGFCSSPWGGGLPD